MANYWGEITATIDWCEPNYVVTPYIAEFWNTVSNLAYILLGCYGLYQVRHLESRFKGAFLALILVGLGSSCFHGTLKWTGQLSDEISMFMVSFILTYILLEQKSKVSSPPYLLIGIFIILVGLYTVLQWVILFQATWLVLTVGIAIRFMQLMPPSQRLKYWRVLYLFLGAAICWLLEQLLCDIYPPVAYLHAFCWHIGTAITTYKVIMGCVRQRERTRRKQMFQA